MSEDNSPDLIDRLLLIVTLNSTLIHFLLSSEVEGTVDPDRVDSLTQGLTRTRKWMEEASAMQGVSSSTSNIIGLIVKRLSQIESILPKLSAKAQKAGDAGTPAEEILSLLESDGEALVKATRKSGTAKSGEDGDVSIEVVPLVGSEPEQPKEPYKRVEVEDDEFGIVGQTQNLITQYSKRCHVLLPTFWLEAIRELHKYRSDSPYLGDVIEIPARVLHKIVKGLLTEAPGARLLQDLHKKRPAENYLDPSEMERVKRAVSRYFSGLELLLKGEDPRAEEKVGEAHTALDGFGWGGPELEKRIIKRTNQQCQETLQGAESAGDDERKAVYAETTKLLCKLQLAILAEPRLREILSQMKP